MAKWTEEECLKHGGRIEYREGPPTWHGKRLKLCIIENAVAEGVKLPWQKKGRRVIILGPE